jgi:hypothetical protein
MPEGRFDVWSGWCVEHGFEFLEADMESSVGAAEAKRLLDDYGEEEERGLGKQRLFEAISSNMWPEMKKKEIVKKEAVIPPEDESNTPAEKSEMEQMLDPEFMRIMGDPDAPDMFEKAISQAREMREHALSLPDDERREFASKMALQLMSLIGEMGSDEDDELAQETD